MLSADIFLSTSSTNGPRFGRLPRDAQGRQLLLFAVKDKTNLVAKVGMSDSDFLAFGRRQKTMSIRELPAFNLRRGEGNSLGSVLIVNTFGRLTSGNYVLEVRQRIFIPSDERAGFDSLILPPVSLTFWMPKLATEN